MKSVQIRSFFYSVFSCIRRDTPYLSVFSPNVGKYGPEKTPYLDTFHTVKVWQLSTGRIIAKSFLSFCGIFMLQFRKHWTFFYMVCILANNLVHFTTQNHCKLQCSYNVFRVSSEKKKFVTAINVQWIITAGFNREPNMMNLNIVISFVLAFSVAKLIPKSFYRK